ncbi:MAG: hypothetical protein SGJ11_02800 [Phycisphaerae bacterium]|nr:hypothetical protein [Phycisphaerae bacterium]
MLVALLCSCVLSASALAPERAAQTAESQTADSLSISLAAITQAEQGRCSIDARQERVEQVLAELQASSRMPLRIDWVALDRLGVEQDDRIDFHASDLPPLLVLQGIAASLGSETERPVVDASAGQIVITTLRAIGTLRQTAIYDTADLIADPSLIDALAALAQADHADPDPAAPAVPGADEAEQGAATTQVQATHDALMQRIITIITDHVDPDGWNENAGDRAIISAEAGRLVISASPMTHRRVRALLQSLRNEVPSSARVSVVVAVIATLELDTITKELETAPSDPSALREAVIAASTFQAAWSPTISTRFDQEATVESASAESETRCAVRVTNDRAKRGMTVAVKFRIKSGERSAAIEVQFAGTRRRSTEVVRLPSGPDADSSWVVLIEAAAATDE